MPILSLAQRARIIALREEGRKISEICSELGVSKPTVLLWLRRHLEEGDAALANRPFGRRKRATTAAEDRAMVLTHETNPFHETRVTATQFHISLHTVRRRLREGRLRYCTAANETLMTQQHKDDRISFCLKYYDFDWQNNIVIFADEKTFKFKSDKDGRKILRRRSNEQYVEAKTLPNRVNDTLTLSFWGWISSMGPGELIEVDGRMNPEQYVEILRDSLLPTVRTSYPEGIIYLMLDNSGVQLGCAVQEWLATQTDIVTIQWPAKSLDLNPIKNFWRQMVLKWDLSQVQNRDDLMQLVFSTWELMRGDEMCWSMVGNMTKRFDAILDSGGGPTL